MKTASIIGSMVVTLALVFYTTGFFKERRKRRVTNDVLFFYTTGVILDITATIFMIIGSSHGMITPHGMIGYSSLLGMLAENFIIWRYNHRNGPTVEVTGKVHLISGITYTWWIIAYITGGLLVAASRLISH